jgi:hypothetical protein
VTIGGFINLALSVGSVTALFVWCVARVLREPQEKVKHLSHVEPIDDVTIQDR